VGEVGEGEERLGVQSSEGVSVILFFFLICRVGGVRKVEIIDGGLLRD